MYVLAPTLQSVTIRGHASIHMVARQPGFEPDQAECPLSDTFRGSRIHTAVAILLFLLVGLCSSGAGAQQVETSLPLSQRFTINLAAGVPQYIGDAASGSSASQSQWWFENTNNSTDIRILVLWRARTHQPTGSRLDYRTTRIFHALSLTRPLAVDKAP